jgi:hypothetical protein
LSAVAIAAGALRPCPSLGQAGCGSNALLSGTASLTIPRTEGIACYEATGQVMWLKKFVPDLRVVDCIHKPLKHYCDNKPAVFYAHNNKLSNATKPIEIKFYAVKDRVRDKTISLEHICTKEMLADPLTEGLPPNVFGEHIAGMSLRESL